MLMSAGNMRVDEVNIDVVLVRRLLAAQFPQWADLPITPVPTAGTDNALYRLGQDMAVRLPRVDWAIEQVEKEQRWLPRLAPHLPLAIPVPLALGTPGVGYSWQWSVYRWLAGQNALIERITDPIQAASALAHFIAALQRIDPVGGPPPGPHNFFRGEPLVMRDESIHANIAKLSGLLDTEAVTAAWEAALQAPVWDGSPVWIHGDLHPGNLLVERGRLSAVIDFGGLGVGDPACDLMVAWYLLEASARNVFRAALQIDDATWARGRGWALWMATGGVTYYSTTSPEFSDMARHAIEEVLADHEHAP
jgi:aminoglycoside phosphotransferase (APT) family kinase protein